MNPLSLILSRTLRDLRNLHFPKARGKCPRCAWEYNNGSGICQHCTLNQNQVPAMTTNSNDTEQCENCGEIVPTEHHIIGIEYQGERERSGSVYYLAGYNCPACGHHAEV